MHRGESAGRPDWVSDEMFPFESRFFTTPRGHVMHYVDEEASERILPHLRAFMR